jgi:hypothetical protein
MRRAYFFLLTMLLPACLLAQPSLGIEASFLAGKVLKHTPKFRAPVPELSTGFELALLKQTDGKYDWEQRRHYPIWGFGASYVHYGIDSIYGSAIGFYPLMQLNIIRGKKLEWTFRAGLGIGYATRHYERAPVWDTLNNAIGSAINNFSTFSTDLRYRLDEHWSLQAGLNFCHLSNGAMKQPNLGVNMGGAHIGLRYWPDGDRPTRIFRPRPNLRNRVLLQARFGMAFNEGGNADGPVYHTYIGSVFLSRRYHSRNKIFVGIDYSYHQGIYAFQRNNEINPGSETAHAWKSAVFVGHEWLLGRLGFVAQIGWYVHEAVLRLDPYYEKLGYNVYLVQRERGPLKELCLSMMLKTHLSSAELVEFGIGAGF